MIIRTIAKLMRKFLELGSILFGLGSGSVNVETVIGLSLTISALDLSVLYMNGGSGKHASSTV